VIIGTFIQRRANKRKLAITLLYVLLSELSCHCIDVVTARIALP